MKISRSFCVRGVSVAALAFAWGCTTAPVLAVSPRHEVGVYCDKGPSGIGAYEWHKLVHDSPDLNLTFLDGDDIRAGALEKLDMLVMPGGSSKNEYLSLGEEGFDRIRAFIRNGGGYIGTCAGCFLVCDQDRDEAKRMHIVPVLYKDPPEGTIFLKHVLTDAGKAGLGLTNGTWRVRFHGGTVMKPTTNTIEGAKFEVWAKYASDADVSAPVTEKNRVSGYDAIMGGTYGKGRVVVFGAHPEYFVGTVPLVDGAFRYVLGDKSVKTVRTYRKPGARSIAIVDGGKKDGMQAAIRLHASDKYDVIPTTSATLPLNGLEHVDLVVFLGGKLGFTSAATKGIFKDYLDHGGKAIVHKKGADILDEVAEALKD